MANKWTYSSPLGDWPDDGPTSQLFHYCRSSIVPVPDEATRGVPQPITWRYRVEYAIRHFFRMQIDRFVVWFMRRLPRRFVVRVVIRAWAEATTGKYNDISATDITVSEMLERFERGDSYGN